MTIPTLLEAAHRNLIEIQSAIQNDQPLDHHAMDAACTSLLAALRTVPEHTANEHLDALKTLQEQIELTLAQAEGYKTQISDQMKSLSQSGQAVNAYAQHGASIGRRTEER